MFIVEPRNELNKIQPQTSLEDTDMFRNFDEDELYLDYPREVVDNEAMKSFVRVLHASPKSPPVDVYIDGTLIVSDFSYKDFTEYLPIEGGREYTISLYPTGDNQNKVFETKVNILPKQIYTIVVAGTRIESLFLLPIIDPELENNEDKFCIRFANLSPNIPSVDLTLEDNSIIFSDISFGQFTHYCEATPGTYSFEVHLNNITTNILSIPDVTLKAGRIYTFYLVGLIGDNPPLQMLIPLDGSTYIDLE